ncbi:3-oxoacyl-[acyl-carrier protein] reductase [Thermocatellispora tengchongensis]|uniref:3-oxoacyl-[acyl-carrier protein] reductase n=1 Tax=Thermocatellispora tengchongensis TaxID=1073253 RepID=A0A840NY09_9ACTN|nr:SDR family oxidoreductase [Thermocatellispora tengchongensis]MBB5132388.1 3-oxoacyl-[acyl-carrier protein] reductase [Thermocatellispora tengchongensis]
MSVLAGKTALVTGGSRGIGRAIVERLAEDGAEVVFGYRSAREAAEEVEAAAKGRAYAVRADQGDPAEVRRLFHEAEERLGGLDILVNNAAINPTAPIAEFTDDDFDRIMAVNAKAVFVAIRLAATRLRDGGRIVNVSTLNTVLPAPGVSLYAASKAAVEQVGAVAAKELGGRGITVNTVAPGAVDTDALRAVNTPEQVAQCVAFTALGRLGEPADIAAVVSFLAGPDGRWITGQTIRATGGYVL